LHAGPQRTSEIRRASFQEHLHIADGFLIDLGRRQVLDAGSEAALDVVLQTRPRVKSRKVDLARRNQKISVNEINDAVREIGGEVGAVIVTAIFSEAARYVDTRPALA